MSDESRVLFFFLICPRDLQEVLQNLIRPADESSPRANGNHKLFIACIGIRIQKYKRSLAQLKLKPNTRSTARSAESFIDSSKNSLCCVEAAVMVAMEWFGSVGKSAVAIAGARA
jgi:hypothetical protein